MGRKTVTFTPQVEKAVREYRAEMLVEDYGDPSFSLAVNQLLALGIAVWWTSPETLFSPSIDDEKAVADSARFHERWSELDTEVDPEREFRRAARRRERTESRYGIPRSELGKTLLRVLAEEFNGSGPRLDVIKRVRARLESRLSGADVELTADGMEKWQKSMEWHVHACRNLADPPTIKPVAESSAGRWELTTKGLQEAAWWKEKNEHGG